MNDSLRHARRLLVLVFAIVTSAATIPVTAAQESAPRHWIGWGLEADFSEGRLEAIYTVYVGIEDPQPRVLAWKQRSINDACDVTGTLQFVDGYAIFDGSTYIECELPAWRDELKALAPQLPDLGDEHCWCEAGGGPLFVAADAKLDAGPSLNPVFVAERTGISFSLPSNAVDARGRLALSSGTYQTPVFAAQTSGNRVLMGQRGRAVVAVASQFGWLDYLDQGWMPYFNSQVSGARMGHWTETPPVGSRTQAAPYQLGTQRDVVYIGHNPASGANFRGALRNGVLDPGCEPPSST